MLRLGELKVKRAFARRHGESDGFWLSAEQIEQLADCRGEMITHGQWGIGYGESDEFATVVANVEEEIDEPAFARNVHPLDVCGCPLKPGKYQTMRGGAVSTGEVYETEDGALWFKIPGSYLQRVDEMARDIEWRPLADAQVG